MRYVCRCCGWVYDEDKGEFACDIEPETQWKCIPDDFECPNCWADKEKFRKVEE